MGIPFFLKDSSPAIPPPSKKMSSYRHFGSYWVLLVLLLFSLSTNTIIQIERNFLWKNYPNITGENFFFKGINPKLGAYLCDNPLCQYSDHIVPTNASIQVISPDEETRTLQRHFHMSGDGKKELSFCTICHNAIEMTNAPANPKDNVRFLKPIPPKKK